MGFYEKYISSNAWRKKAEERKKIDNNQCQLWLDHEGPFEVHHKTYEHLGNEPLEDLITVCKSCHDVITNTIREGRYSQMEVIGTDVECKSPQMLEEVSRSDGEVPYSDVEDKMPKHNQ